ncbi:hypothetical protein [Amycolatopsis taiwanensis]|uniref:hypothetical protein n=1 Tax=Amycolatopsis taiwanensis TaxID=342230 RepID=UPI0004865418|nr:hypothetical protein [Amycolatopsis taiwanensis]
MGVKAFAKPITLVVVGLFLIIGAFAFGVSDPSCGRGKTLSHGEVCVNTATGEEQDYDEAQSSQDKEIKIAMPIIGGIVILVGIYTGVQRYRARTRDAGTGQARDL